MSIQDCLFFRHFCPAERSPVRKCGFFLPLLLLHVTMGAGLCLAGEETAGFSGQVTLSNGQLVVIAEGEREPRSIGSYTIRLYSGRNRDFPYDDFLAGMVRVRNGFVERVAREDLDDDGAQEVIVIIRHAGSGSYLSADAFTVTEKAVFLSGTVASLAPDSDPVTELRKKTGRKEDRTNTGKSSSCDRVTGQDHVLLPAIGVRADLDRIREICTVYGLARLWEKIEADPPAHPFASDGCSLWFNERHGTSLYPACFLHDLKYWAGYPGEDVERLIADAELMIDIACLVGTTPMAEAMFHGTRVGGHEMYKQSFSWGFGRAR